MAGAISSRRTPRASAWATTDSMTSPMWSTSRRVPWNALLAVTAPSTSQIGRMPRWRAARGALDHDRRRAHAEDHPVAPAVERHGGFLDVLVGGGGARREEARTHPAEEVVGGDVVGGDDHDALAAARPDPVLGQRDGLRRARARRVDLGVRPPRPDQLGELRVPHRQDTEQEATVERVAVLIEGELQVVDAPVDLGQRRSRGRRLGRPWPAPPPARRAPRGAPRRCRTGSARRRSR